MFSSPPRRAYAGEVVVVMGNGVHVPIWVAPILTVASMCQHVSGARHRLVVFDLEGLVGDLSELAGSVPVPLGGIQVGTFGIVLRGFAAVDVMAVDRNVLWEDEHCLACCGALLRFSEPLSNRVLVRCGPTIGAREGSAAEVTDEYWTD